MAVGKPTNEKPSKLYALEVKDARDDSQSTYSICVLLVPWRIGKEIKSRMNR